MSISASTNLDAVCKAIMDEHDEATLWQLADELIKVAPSGVKAVEAVHAEATNRGIPVKSVNTLRLYRDVAIRFPASERVPMVTFSAHREAIAVGDTAKAKQVLTELAAKHGPAKVTVTTVKQAIGVTTGKVPTPKAKTATPPTTYGDIAVDLSTGHGKRFIAEVDAMLAVPNVTLDGLHSGLSKVLAAIEAKRAKAARAKVAPAKAVDPAKSAAAAKARRAAAKASSAKPTGKATATKGAKAGDLRDL